MAVIIEAIKALAPHYPALLTVVGSFAALAFLLRGFTYKDFHYAGWTELWLRNGDRNPHHFEIRDAHINPTARQLARLERKWRRRIIAVGQDPKHDQLMVDFFSNKFISLDYARMWRRLINELHGGGCCFRFWVLDGEGQQPLLDELNGAICDYVKGLHERKENYQMPPVKVISAVTEYDAPNRELTELLEGILFNKEQLTWPIK